MNSEVVIIGLIALQCVTLLVWAIAPDTLHDTYREVTGWVRRLFPPLEEAPPTRRAKAKRPVGRRKRAVR
jgi:hypothetical protein